MPNWKFLLFVGGIIGGLYYGIKAIFLFILAIGYFVRSLIEKLTETNTVKTRKSKTIKMINNTESGTNDNVTIIITNNSDSATNDTVKMTNKTESGPNDNVTITILSGNIMTNQAKIEEDAILIRVAQLYREDISDIGLYEITRGIWKIGKRREKAKFAFSIFKGEIKAVYKINSWHNALTTKYETRTENEMTSDGTLPINNRYEFLGEISEEMQNKYLGKSVENYFPRGASNPIKYINC